MLPKVRRVPLLGLLATMVLAVVSWTLFRRGAIVRGALWQPSSTVVMTGQGSRWWIRYPGQDGRIGTPDDLFARDNLHVPAGFDVHLVLRSEDYIYLFSVPALGLKQVAVPGLEQSVTFRADRPEVHPLQAEPMCGRRADHDERLVVQEPAEFESWLASLRHSQPQGNR